MMQYSPLVTLFILALAVACIAWTVTKEEVFREWREYVTRMSKRQDIGLLRRKFFYVWTCYYCFSHWVTFVVLCLTKFRLGYNDWRGYLVALFAMVLVANVYLTGFNYARAALRHKQAVSSIAEQREEVPIAVE